MASRNGKHHSNGARAAELGHAASRLKPRKPPDYDDPEDVEEIASSAAPSRMDCDALASRLDRESDQDSDEDDDLDVDEGSPGATKKHPRPRDEFVGSRYHSRRDDRGNGVFVPDWALILGKTKAEALVLSQLAYWFGESNKGEKGKIRATNRDDYWWVWKTYRELGRELFLTPFQVRGAIRSLTKTGLIVVHARRNGELNRFRLDPIRIEEALASEMDDDCTVS